MNNHILSTMNVLELFFPLFIINLAGDDIFVAYWLVGSITAWANIEIRPVSRDTILVLV